MSETIFGVNTFLPEIVPLKVHRNRSDNGDLGISIDLLYSDDATVTWIAHGGSKSFIDEISLLLGEAIPSRYTLQMSIPREVFQKRDVPNSKVNSEEENEGVFSLEDDEFLVDHKEVYVKLQSQNFPEAAVLIISLDDDDTGDNSEVTVDSAGSARTTVIDEALPKFPEMQESYHRTIVVQPGERSVITLDVMFTDNDRYSVKGLIYNSSNNRIFTTLWSTSYLLGPSEFEKIPHGNDGVSDYFFQDTVKLQDVSDPHAPSSVKQIVISIPTENNDISGLYTVIAHHEASAEDSGLILESSLEQTFVLRRESQEHGPIPSGVLEFQGGNYSQMSCKIGQECLLTCHVFGTAVQILDLMHKNAASQFVTLLYEDVEYGTYESSVMALVDSSNPNHSGTYLCKAESGLTSISKEIDVFFVDK